MVHRLLEHKAEVSAKTIDGETPLHIAARCGHEVVGRQLVTNGADVSAKAVGGKTPLHAAPPRLLQFFLEQGADASPKDREGSTPLHDAVTAGDVAGVRVLLAHGADASAMNSTGFAPLHLAALQGNTVVVQMLLDNGADPLGTNMWGQCPDIIAAGMMHAGLAATLQAAKARAEVLRRAKCVAFAMGLHERLGVGSCVQEIDAGVARMVLELLANRWRDPLEGIGDLFS